jgi:hypothetical protein
MNGSLADLDVLLDKDSYERELGSPIDSRPAPSEAALLFRVLMQPHSLCVKFGD